ncbi:hypothetical protein JZK55_10880 [Dissulfurispira thermophila]|uniref:Toprim domain-containing protein n=1 Tax=Dissulfurispira thermophila TaxID=2715679 RepID=A0A7G1H2K0_9BACT|nr:hypothetical protein JZK55_10880 [Dissulfurispira thermophila]
MIYPDEGKFHCFGCGEHGSYADFLIKTGVAADFKEAIKELHNIAGVPYGNDKKHNNNKKIALLFKDALKKNKSAMEYIKKRGISESSIEKFMLGYGVPTRELREGVPENLFSNRIIFPIIMGKEMYGFTGRSIDGTLPKYKNSPGLNKNKLLYGLFPQSVKSWGFIILVEGYIDAIMMHQYGFDNTAGVMGSSLSNEQIDLIKGYPVVLAFDGDKAGQEAAKKAAKDLLKMGVHAKIAELPDKKDPADIIAEGDDMASIIDNAIPAVEFLLKMAAD